jgi:hypothetical protein
MTKIEALEKTIYNLENDVYEYDWTDCDKCNCGVVARTVLDGELPTKNGLDDFPVCIDDEDYEFPFASNGKCMITDMPLPKVFRLLKESGFEYEELKSLEFLTDKSVLLRMKSKADYDEKDDLIAYLKAWVEILKEQEVKTPKVERIYIPVIVPETILKDKEIVLS